MVRTPPLPPLAVAIALGAAIPFGYTPDVGDDSRTLVDAHLHLQEDVFAPHMTEVLGRASQAGIRYLVCNGAMESDWPRVLQLAREHPNIVPCFGLHPWYVSQRSDHWVNTLEQFLNAVPSGIGEIGVDRWIEPRDEAAQEKVFRLQLELARQRRLPAMVHCVRAWGWLMDVLRSEPPLPAGLLLHAYGGSADLIKPLADLGAYFSYGGTTLDPRKKVRRETLPLIPRDRLLLETDAPDLPPPEPFWPHKLADADGKPCNEPANLRPIFKGIAALLNEDEEKLAERVWENSLRFFGQILQRRMDTHD
jgi:TatD DNase family protein